MTKENEYATHLSMYCCIFNTFVSVQLHIPGSPQIVQLVNALTTTIQCFLRNTIIIIVAISIAPYLTDNGKHIMVY